MVRRCENCNRPLLDSDVKCYHCGEPVPGREALAEDATRGDSTLDLRTSTRYGAVLIGLMAIGVLVMNWLGAGYSGAKAPAATPLPPADWRAISHPDGHYWVWLPNNWQIYTPASGRWEATLAEVAHPIPEAFNRQSPFSTSERVSLVAKSPAGASPHPLIFSIDCHPALANYNLAVLQHDYWSVNQTPIDTTGSTNVMLRPTGQPALIAELIYPDPADGTLLHTITMIVQSKRGMYAITVSGSGNDFLEGEEILWAILDSFQPQD